MYVQTSLSPGDPDASTEGCSQVVREQKRADLILTVIKQYVVDSIVSDRQWSLVCCYLNALYNARKIDGEITFNGNR